jgi:hypothetical protein
MNTQWNQVASQLFDAKQERKRFEDIEASLQKKLIILSNDKTTIGDRFLFVKDFRKGSISYELIPELINVNLEQYRKSEVPMWKLSEK